MDIFTCGVVPVVVLHDAQNAVRVANALLKGGINTMEITFRTTAAKEAIQKVAQEVPEIIVGAGTVINMEQMQAAKVANAKFVVSPGIDEELLKEAKRLELPIIPGVVSPSEIILGLKYDIKVFKFFPAEAYGGLKTLKALCGPFPQIRFLPTGGISQSNAEEYFQNQKIAAVGGSWMVSTDMIAQGQYDLITEKSKDVVELFKRTRAQQCLEGK